MRAMIWDRPGAPLRWAEAPEPPPGEGEVAIRVRACGVCRTDLHILDGELDRPKLPLILGHQIVGTVIGGALPAGSRVGVPWLAWSCGACAACASGRTNLCDRARFTGYDVDGGYAERCVASASVCVPIPDEIDDVSAAPLLCAGAIGWRALRFAGDAGRIGLYGFGAAASLLAPIAVHQGRRVFAFTRPGDRDRRRAAIELGAAWAGGSDEAPPEPLDAAILFAPAGELIPIALGAVTKGGVVVCAEIHMSDVPSFPYARLWGERVLRSVANVTRRDAEEVIAIASRIGLRPRVTTWPLERANEAIEAVRAGRADGSAVLSID